MKQVLIFCFLFSASHFFAQSSGDVFFSEGIVHDIRFNFSQTGYWDSLKANYILDAYMRCDVTVDGATFPVSGVKFKGNSSYNNLSNKKPFRLDLSEYGGTLELDGMEKLVLNNAFKDPTFLREKLMLDFLNAHGIMAPRSTFARLYINNKYWGLYSVVEDVNKTFLKNRFDNKSGNLFKGDPRGTLNYKGEQQALYATDYELKTNETENDWSDLIHFTNVLNNTPAAQLRDSLERYLNVDSWFSYWAAHNLFVNLDSYIGSGHNYFLYHNPDTDKFEWITWDVNEAFGNFQMGISLANIKTLAYGFIPQPANQRPMMNRVWADQNMRQLYGKRLCTLLADFSNQKMDARIDELANLIRPHVYADSMKFYSNNYFELNLAQDITIPNVPGTNGIAGLKSFITARRNALLQQLANVCSATETTEIPALQPLSLSPNPASRQVLVALDGTQMQELRLMTVEGKLVYSQNIDNQFVIAIDLPDLPQGIYCLQVSTYKGLHSAKLAIIK
jgi:spore coat protein CotH